LSGVAIIDCTPFFSLPALGEAVRKRHASLRIHAEVSGRRYAAALAIRT
jgi:hypothetical protein